MGEADWTTWEALLCKGKSGKYIPRDVASMEAVEHFAAEMVESTAYRDDVIVEGVNTPMIAACRDNKTCNIRALPGSDLHIGDRVECMGEEWIIIELFIDQLGIYHGVMWICNSSLRFQNNSTQINVRRCIVDDGSYMRLTRNFAVYVPQNTYTVYVAYDDEVKKLYVDKRISFGTSYDSDGNEVLEVYKITGIDVQSDNYGTGSHLVTMKVQRDVYNPGTDSIETMICDCFNTPHEEDTPSTTGSSLISGRDYVRIGTTRKFVASFYDDSGNEVFDAVAVWNVSCADSISVIADGNTLSISIPLIDDLVGDQITIVLSDEAHKYGSYEKKVQVNPIG